MRTCREEVAGKVMDALDSWIEEQQQPEREPEAGDTVKLKRKLEKGDGSMTDKVCTIPRATSMEGIDPSQPFGEVVDVLEARVGHGKEALVSLLSTGDEWYFHIDDLEVTH